MLRPFVQPVACCCAKFKTGQTFSYVLLRPFARSVSQVAFQCFLFPVHRFKFQNDIYMKKNNTTLSSFPHPTKYRPFSGSPKRLFQSEAKYEAIDMKLFFILMQMTLIITRKVLHEASFKSKGFQNSEKAY